jgi:hypothetical protein
MTIMRRNLGGVPRTVFCMVESDNKYMMKSLRNVARRTQIHMQYTSSPDVATFIDNGGGFGGFFCICDGGGSTSNSKGNEDVT